MMSTPLFLGVLFLVQLSVDVSPEKILDVSKGSTAVLRPDLVEAEVISITWKYGDKFAADWHGPDVPFYRSFKDGCSLGTKTGELIIHDVKLEDGGVYTPEINSKTLTAVTLRVYSPVPKPHITLNCSPEKTKCSLTCSFDRTDEMGDVEVFWIVGDTIEKGGGELHISKETKEKTFICRLNNTVSSENSNELQNPFWTDDSPRRIHDIKLIVVALFAVLICLMSFYIHLRVVRKRNKTKQSKDCNPMIVMECEQSLLDVYQLVLDFFSKRNPKKPYEESDRTLLKVYHMISSLLRKEDAANPAEDPKTQEPTGYPELASSSKNKPSPATGIYLEAVDPNRD